MMKRKRSVERVERVRELLAKRAKHELIALTARMEASRRAVVDLQFLGGMDAPQRYRAGILGSRMEMAEALNDMIEQQTQERVHLAKHYETAESSYQQIKRSAQRQRDACDEDDARRSASALDALGLANWHWRKSR